LLAREHIPQVRALITAGSQAPLLHELGALASLEQGAVLPETFPRWLNVYDPYDFLSYLAGRVFKGRATDLCVQSLQPFPQSHSAYWTNPEMWKAVKAFLQ